MNSPGAGKLHGCQCGTRSAPAAGGTGTTIPGFAPPPSGTLPARRRVRCPAGPGRAQYDAPAVSAEELPIRQPRCFGDGLYPPYDLRVRQPEHPLTAPNPSRRDRVQRFHGSGCNGHHRADRLHVGLGAYDDDAAAAIVPAVDVTPDERRSLGPAPACIGGVDGAKV